VSEKRTQDFQNTKRVNHTTATLRRKTDWRTRYNFRYYLKASKTEFDYLGSITVFHLRLIPVFTASCHRSSTWAWLPNSQLPTQFHKDSLSYYPHTQAYVLQIVSSFHVSPTKILYAFLTSLKRVTSPPTSLPWFDHVNTTVLLVMLLCPASSHFSPLRQIYCNKFAGSISQWKFITL
jgi:hypothetical protein